MPPTLSVGHSGLAPARARRSPLVSLCSRARLVSIKCALDQHATGDGGHGVFLADLGTSTDGRIPADQPCLAEGDDRDFDSSDIEPCAGEPETPTHEVHLTRGEPVVTEKAVQIVNGWVDDVPHISSWLPNSEEFASPLEASEAFKVNCRQYWVEKHAVIGQSCFATVEEDTGRVIAAGTGAFFRRSGPREKVLFKPQEVRAAIVTCGGLSPGINTVIRELVHVLWYTFGVSNRRQILGVEFGFKGFYSRNLRPLTPALLEGIHKRGGTVLGTSRGGFDANKIADSIIDRRINQVYVIGGDGSQRGQLRIYEELRRRKAKVAVVGIPKTIDNDLAIVDSSFGFETAVEEAVRAIAAAKVEAQSVNRGIGLVKLMGRQSGFIAMNATFASGDADCCLVPEVEFYLRGPGGLFQFVKQRLAERGDCVIVLAEGAGQHLMAKTGKGPVTLSSDASGNPGLMDIGSFLVAEMKAYLQEEQLEGTIKYIDPTYSIRAVCANGADQINCARYAHGAVHGAMAGFSGFCVGLINSRLAYIPTSRITSLSPVRINTKDRSWARLLTQTGQPIFYAHGENAKGYSRGPSSGLGGYVRSQEMSAIALDASFTYSRPAAG